MGIFNEFFKKEKPVFTGSRFGFGSGGGGGGAPLSVTGGNAVVTVADGGDGQPYQVHRFTSSGSLVVANKPVTCDILCVAGGGGGGADIGGGGGGGGFRTLTSEVRQQFKRTALLQSTQFSYGMASL